MNKDHEGKGGAAGDGWKEKGEVKSGDASFQKTETPNDSLKSLPKQKGAE